MLRHLARITRAVPAAGTGALAVAVYATADGTPVPARDRGYEGVACVDDAARLLGLLARVWQRTSLDHVRTWALGLAEFVLWMEEEDGSWVNFISGWDGHRNAIGPTSEMGENFWQARAVAGLADAWLAFGDPRIAAAARRGIDRAVDMAVPSDVRALHLRAALHLLDRPGFDDLRGRTRAWADEIAACRDDGGLMNNPDERGVPHLWAHVQEAVLADAAEALHDPDLLSVAVRSADAVLLPIVADGFDRPSTSPYDVACVVTDLDRLASATGQTRFATAAADARAWFSGRNPAGVAVYDRDAGRVCDGLDGTVLNTNAGAESNVEAGLALLDDAIASAPLARPDVLRR